MTKEQQQAPKTVQVVFIKDHRNGGVDYAKGQKAIVIERSIAKLKKLGVIE